MVEGRELFFIVDDEGGGLVLLVAQRYFAVVMVDLILLRIAEGEYECGIVERAVKVVLEVVC